MRYNTLSLSITTIFLLGSLTLLSACSEPEHTSVSGFQVISVLEDSIDPGDPAWIEIKGLPDGDQAVSLFIGTSEALIDSVRRNVIFFRTHLAADNGAIRLYAGDEQASCDLSLRLRPRIPIELRSIKQIAPISGLPGDLIGIELDSPISHIKHVYAFIDSVQVLADTIIGSRIYFKLPFLSAGTYYDVGLSHNGVRLNYRNPFFLGAPNKNFPQVDSVAYVGVEAIDLTGTRVTSIRSDTTVETSGISFSQFVFGRYTHSRQGDSLFIYCLDSKFNDHFSCTLKLKIDSVNMTASGVMQLGRRHPRGIGDDKDSVEVEFRDMRWVDYRESMHLYAYGPQISQMVLRLYQLRVDVATEVHQEVRDITDGFSFNVYISKGN